MTSDDKRDGYPDSGQHSVTEGKLTRRIAAAGAAWTDAALAPAGAARATDRAAAYAAVGATSAPRR
ncbi:MAG: hypothetical protein LBD97_09625 [Bifidobacteriaceae bacterium]|nr:hypothetical protein [Bifidobacteriaceae bacterium]